MGSFPEFADLQVIFICAYTDHSIPTRVPVALCASDFGWAPAGHRGGDTVVEPFRGSGIGQLQGPGRVPEYVLQLEDEEPWES